MAYDFNGSTQYLRLTSSIVTAAPLTLAAWANADTGLSGADNERTILSISDFDYNIGGNDQCFKIEFGRSGGVNDGIAAASSAGTGGFSLTGTGPANHGQWYHLAGVFTSSTSRTVYLDGTAGATDTTSVTPSNVSDIGIGCSFRSSALLLPFDGKVAEAAIWNVALTAAEITSLSKGLSPLFIRPQSLVFYAPIVRELVERKAGTSLTNVASSAVSDHPRIYYPATDSSIFAPVVAAPSVTPLRMLMGMGT